MLGGMENTILISIFITTPRYTSVLCMLTQSSACHCKVVVMFELHQQYLSLFKSAAHVSFPDYAVGKDTPTLKTLDNSELTLMVFSPFDTMWDIYRRHNVPSLLFSKLTKTHTYHC